MANQAAKKGAQRASRALTIWISVVIAVYATYLPVAFYVDDPTSWSWLYFAWQAALGVTYYVAITGIASSAEQGNEGALYHDLIYLIIASQLGSLYSYRAWWIMISIPLYGLYKGYSFYRSFQGQSASDSKEVILECICQRLA
eukprot:gb/GECG01004233.1/.p1 GENE.gb/GECG01004233.1/~~gb/GECG01004233.1/.p1  ORF type:complete len:143 (+),score=8.39 gb/GECG01004233.1/:1-429(+)